MLPYVDAVDAVTVMRVLLFVVHVCMLRECEGARVTKYEIVYFKNMILKNKWQKNYNK